MKWWRAGCHDPGLFKVERALDRSRTSRAPVWNNVSCAKNKADNLTAGIRGAAAHVPCRLLKSKNLEGGGMIPTDTIRRRCLWLSGNRDEALFVGLPLGLEPIRVEGIADRQLLALAVLGVKLLWQLFRDRALLWKR